MIKNVCLLMSPAENSLKYPGELSRLSINLGLGVICGYLEERGFGVSIRDLNVTLAERFKGKDDRVELEKIFEIDVFRRYIEGEDNKDIDNLMSKFLSDINMDKYQIFGISIGSDFSFLQIQTGFFLSKYIMKTYNVPVFIGGNNISFLNIYKDIFAELWDIVGSEFQFIINGPGEKVIERIITGINDNQAAEYFEQLPGIIRKVNGELVCNKVEQPIVVKPSWGDMDLSHYSRCMVKENGTEEQISAIKRENEVYYYKWADTYIGSPGLVVNQYNRKKRNDVEEKLILPYIFNYNCPYNCAFCTQSDYERGNVIGENAEIVIKHLKELKEKYNTKYFYFLNNAFNYSGKFADEFCKYAIEENLDIVWSDCGRFNNLTYERLKLMRDAGCRKLTFGFESGSKKIIELIDKRIDLDQAEKVLKWCNELGIWSDIEVIIGLPQEFDEEFQETCNFIKKNSKYINYFWVNEFFIVPNSLIGRHPERYGIEIDYNRESYRSLLEDNLKIFKMTSEDTMTRNSKLYGFNEKEGRTFNDIIKQNQKKISILNSLQDTEIDTAAKFYKMLLQRL